MFHKLLVILMFVILTTVGRVSASDGNGTPAVNTVTITRSSGGSPVPYVDSTRANFDSGSYTSGAGNTQWWGFLKI